jgi:hypothetical protein
LGFSLTLLYRYLVLREVKYIVQEHTVDSRELEWGHESAGPYNTAILPNALSFHPPFQPIPRDSLAKYSRGGLHKYLGTKKYTIIIMTLAFSDYI